MFTSTEVVPKFVPKSQMSIELRPCPAAAEAGLADGPGDGEVAGDDGAAVLPHRRPAARDRDDRVPGISLKC